jgi:hypothetical protein
MLSGVSLGRRPIMPIGRGWSWATVPGYSPRPVEDNIVFHAEANPGYFRAAGIAMVSGRDFEEKDRRGLACFWPVRRAARLDPVQSLRGE